jgi:signal transduction histidine kinase
MKQQTELGRALIALRTGVVLFRWAALAWMAGLAITAPGGFARAGYAWAGIGCAAAFTAWASVPRPVRTGRSLWVELALAFGLIVMSGFVVDDVVGGRVFYATGWPVAAVVALGVARGATAGVLGGLLMGLGLVLSRVVNGVTHLSGAQTQALVSGAITFVLAGWALGLASDLLRRSEDEHARLVDEAMRARERAARLEERESLARRIHDSVLQALAMVHKRGRELAAGGPVDAGEVARLAETAGEQEAALRALIVRAPLDPPTGTSSLRDRLEETARAVAGVPVTVSATGPMWIAAHAADEIAQAVRQALDNVVEHAGATRATVFADLEDGAVVVTVRDDGGGFEYDPGRLRDDGKLGILSSMKGRVEGLGGTMHVESSERGTEIEFRMPADD